ncbi:MAG: type II secretion system protein [Betaproteobacteria bacterium]|nr:type II secretion system protein [Betaproteobacteria bacterium]
MRQQKKLKPLQHGFTLVEFGIVALIIAFLTAIVGGSFIIRNQQATGLEVGKSVAEAMRKMKSRGSDTFPANATAAFISTNAFDQQPLFRVNAGRTTVDHLIADPAAITAAAASGVLTVTIAGVPSYACENLVAAMDSASTTITVGSTVVKTATSTKVDLNQVSCAFGTTTTVVATIR